MKPGLYACSNCHMLKQVKAVPDCHCGKCNWVLRKEDTPEWICPSCKETGVYTDLPEHRSIDICRACGNELMNYEKWQMTRPRNLPEVPGDNKKG